MEGQARLNYMEQRKTPAVATILSCVCTGAGQIYNGEVGKGIGMIVAGLVCLLASELVLPAFAFLGLWIWGMFDAHKVATEFNEALRYRCESQEVEERAATQRTQVAERTAAEQTISSQAFVVQIEKYLKLFQNNLLSESEFEERKNNAIELLIAKKLAEPAEDFLSALIPLIQKKAFTDQEISKIKIAVF